MPYFEAFRHWMGQHGRNFLQPILARAEGEPANLTQDAAAFRQHIIVAAVAASPLQLRLADPSFEQLSSFLLDAREQLFHWSDAGIRLRPDWTQVLAQFCANAAPGIASEHSAATAGERALPPAADSVQSVDIPLGIDLGTTYSVVAHLDAQGRPVSIPNSSGDLLTPSVVLFDDDATVVGKEAVMAAALEPDRVADCVKRDMGSKHYRKPIRGELLPPEVISSLILRQLKRDAELKLGPVTKAVITVPAYFDETRRRATMDAGRLAGLEVLDIVNEPTAAAIAYGYQAGYLDTDGSVKGDRPIRLLVYDLGGGTFDVTIVEMSGQSFKAVATDGDVRLGGKDWDEKLIDMMAEAFRLAHASDPRASAETMQDLWSVAESVKRSLSERHKATAVINHQAVRFKMEVTRQQFEEATAPLVLRTRTTTEIVLLQAGLSWSDINKVLLVGGSTRMPMIGKMILELSGKQPDRAVSVDEAVAHGAALYADMLLKRRGLGPGHTEFTVSNINSHSLGIVGVQASTGRRVTTSIIPKNTPLPHTAYRRFRTAKAGQTSVRICVLEGESEYPEACVEVGVATVRGLPPNLPAGWPVEVCYSYGEGGRLQVSGKLVGHEAAVAVEFTRDNSLSDNDLMLWAQCLDAAEARQTAAPKQNNEPQIVPPQNDRLRVLKQGQALYGPISRGELEQLIQQGRINVSDQVSCNEGPWRPISDFLAERGTRPGTAPRVPAGAAAAVVPGPVTAAEKSLRVLSGGKVYGPMSRAQVMQLLADGRLTSNDLICAIDGAWMPLTEFLARPEQRDLPTEVRPAAAAPPSLPPRSPAPISAAPVSAAPVSPARVASTPTPVKVNVPLVAAAPAPVSPTPAPTAPNSVAPGSPAPASPAASPVLASPVRSTPTSSGPARRPQAKPVAPGTTPGTTGWRPAPRDSENEIMQRSLEDVVKQPAPVDPADILAMPPGSSRYNGSLLEDLEDKPPAPLPSAEWCVRIRGMLATHLTVAQVRSLVISREIHHETPTTSTQWDEGVWRPFRAVRELAELVALLPPESSDDEDQPLDM